MRYTLTEEERNFVQTALDKFLTDFEPVNFAGTSISPYNLREVLMDNGFTEDVYDNNSMDYWWYFIHSKYGRVVMYFEANSFMLVLSKDEE